MAVHAVAQTCFLLSRDLQVQRWGSSSHPSCPLRVTIIPSERCSGTYQDWSWDTGELLPGNEESEKQVTPLEDPHLPSAFGSSPQGLSAKVKI